MLCFLRDIRSYRQLCVILHLFSKYSGLQVNNDKTEIFAVGPHQLDEDSFSHRVCTSIKILGIVFDYHIPSRTKANFDFIFKSIQEMLNMWKWRGLTLIAKIEIVKSLITPKCLSKAPLISVTDDLVQEINKLIYRFIWMGTDKIKRCALINDIEDGGLKMLDIQSMILARRILIFKRYVENKYGSPWKVILDYFLSGVGEKFILQCNFDTRKLPIYLPAFYRECLDAWATLNEFSVLSYEDVVNQIIWNKKNITIGKASIFDKKGNQKRNCYDR